MVLRKTSAGVLLVATTLLAGLTGCDAGPAKTESRSFPFSGTLLVIDTRETELRIANGDGADIEVERSLEGDAGDDGDATWALDGDTLKLSVNCSGLVLECASEHTVKVPKGVAIELKSSGSPVRIDALAGDLTATLTNDGSLRASNPAGKLRLKSGGGDIVVTGARSRDVTASTTADANIKLGFAVAPDRVEANASGSVEVTLPKGPETYKIVGSADGLDSDPASKRVITVTAVDGRIRVNKA